MKRFKRFTEDDICEYADISSTDIYCIRKLVVKETTGRTKGYAKGCGRVGYGSHCPYSDDGTYDACGCNTRKLDKRR